MYNKYIKRFLDICISLFAFIVLSPILIITAIAIKIESHGPVLFKQKRLGKDGKEFYMYKFRSMCIGAESMGIGHYSFKSDPRITKIGRIIRAASIDELPQFINILKGEMSLIGFRPPLTYHPWAFTEYTDEQKIMFRLRPGITGWAQIHGRKKLQWDKRIEMGVWYAQNVSLKIDAVIFFLTIWKVLKNEDNTNTVSTVATYQNEPKQSAAGKEKYNVR